MAGRGKNEELALLALLYSHLGGPLPLVSRPERSDPSKPVLSRPDLLSLTEIPPGSITRVLQRLRDEKLVELVDGSFREGGVLKPGYRLPQRGVAEAKHVYGALYSREELGENGRLVAVGIQLALASAPTVDGVRALLSYLRESSSEGGVGRSPPSGGAPGEGKPSPEFPSQDRDVREFLGYLSAHPAIESYARGLPFFRESMGSLDPTLNALLDKLRTENFAELGGADDSPMLDRALQLMFALFKELKVVPVLSSADELSGIFPDEIVLRGVLRENSAVLIWHPHGPDFEDSRSARAQLRVQQARRRAKELRVFLLVCRPLEGAL